MEPPFRVEVTKFLRADSNQLEVRVTNLWPNRFIGDEQEPDDCVWVKDVLKEIPAWLTEGKPRPSAGRYTFTVSKFYSKDSSLLESGLLSILLFCKPSNKKVSGLWTGTSRLVS